MKLNQSGQHNRKGKIRFDIRVPCLFSCHPGSLNKVHIKIEFVYRKTISANPEEGGKGSAVDRLLLNQTILFPL